MGAKANVLSRHFLFPPPLVRLSVALNTDIDTNNNNTLLAISTLQSLQSLHKLPFGFRVDLKILRFFGIGFWMDTTLNSHEIDHIFTLK